MGDIAKKTRYEEREQRANKIEIKENSGLDKLISKGYEKDKVTTIRMNSTTYNKFKIISEKKGLNVNACINLIVNDYVREHKEYLED